MDQGQRVVGLGRSSQSTLDGNVAYLAGDRSDTSFVRRVVADQKIEVVVDVIPMTTFETRPLLESLDGTIRQYVMISSSDVYANYELLHKRSHGNPTQSALDEESPLRSTAFPYREPVPRATDAGDRYLDDYDKIPIEAAVQHLSSAWTVLRLPMVYGPGDKQRRFRWAIAPMVRGDETLTVPRDWANWRSTYGYVENVGAAIAITVGDASAENRIFNIAEARPVSQLEWPGSLPTPWVGAGPSS